MSNRRRATGRLLQGAHCLVSPLTAARGGPRSAHDRRETDDNEPSRGFAARRILTLTDHPVFMAYKA